MKKNDKNNKKINKQKRLLKKNLGCQMDKWKKNLDHEMEKR